MPTVKFNIPTYAEQLHSLRLYVKPPQAKPKTTSLSLPQLNSTKQEKPPSLKPQKHKKKLQPSENLNPSDSDDSSTHKDKTLLNDKSFLTSTLKNLTDLTCSRPRQPDHIDLPFPSPKQLGNTNDTIQPPKPTRYIEIESTSSQTKLTYDMQKPKCNITSHKLTFIKQIITHPIDQFSKEALLIAHNSLPNIQPT